MINYNNHKTNNQEKKQAYGKCSAKIRKVNRRSKLCRPVVHGHPLTSRGNMMWKVYNIIITAHALYPPTC